MECGPLAKAAVVERIFFDSAHFYLIFWRNIFPLPLMAMVQGGRFQERAPNGLTDEGSVAFFSSFFSFCGRSGKGPWKK